MNMTFEGTASDSPLSLRAQFTWTDNPDCVIFPACVNGETADSLHQDGVIVIGSSQTAELLPTHGQTLEAALRAFDFPLRRLNGIPFILTTWWNGRELSLHTINFPDAEIDAGKQFIEAGLSTAVLRCESPIMERLGYPLTNLMSRHNYRGPIHVYCRADSDRHFAVEGLTFGLDSLSTYTTLEIWRLTPQELFEHLANPDGDLHPREAFGVALFVYAEKPLHSRYPQVWTSPIGAIVSARGEKIAEAVRRVYRSVRNLALPDELSYSQSLGAAANSLLNRVRWWV